MPVIAYNRDKVAQAGLPTPTDEMTFEDLAAWAQKGTSGDVFGYFRGHSGKLVADKKAKPE